MNVKTLYGYGFIITMPAFTISACNAHLTALDHNPAPLEYEVMQNHTQLSANLDQILEARIDHAVTNSDRAMISKTDSIVSDPGISMMDNPDIYYFHTNGQMQLDCYGSYCEGVVFNGNIAIDINHYTRQVSIDHIRLQDDAKMFTLSGRISKSFGKVSTILNPAAIEMTLQTPNTDIPLDPTGVLNIRDLPPYDNPALQTDVELSHIQSQTYLTGQLISVND